MPLWRMKAAISVTSHDLLNCEDQVVIGRELVMEHTPAMGVMQEMEQGQGTTMAAGEITVVVDFYPAAEDLIVFLPCMEGQALKVPSVWCQGMVEWEVLSG